MGTLVVFWASNKTDRGSNVHFPYKTIKFDQANYNDNFSHGHACMIFSSCSNKGAKIAAYT